MRFSPRVTVSAVIERDRKFLVVEEDVRGRIVLNNPAGHLEDEETLVDAAIREVQEETGCEFRPDGITGIYLWKTPKGDLTFLRVNFFGRAVTEDRDAQLDDGIIATHWLTREELAERASELRSPMVLGGIDDYLAGKRYPLDTLKDMGQGFFSDASDDG
ncbi:MAG: NUDIX hydrolase [Gammaproteobacteria bacterium]|nr:NUDIX hydrolase [Gammaproteobacteria bacterium]